METLSAVTRPCPRLLDAVRVTYLSTLRSRRPQCLKTSPKLKCQSPSIRCPLTDSASLQQYTTLWDQYSFTGLFSSPLFRSFSEVTAFIQQVAGTFELTLSGYLLPKGEITQPLVQEKLDTQSDDETIKEGFNVHTKFILQQKCSFGQRFVIVGDHDLLGKWNLEESVPMEWSNGDIWGGEVDFPVGERVEFKYVLIGHGNEVEWQPGPNRIFETKEFSPLIVAETWDFVGDKLEELGMTDILEEGAKEQLVNEADVLVANQVSKDEKAGNIGQLLEEPQMNDILGESADEQLINEANIAMADVISEDKNTGILRELLVEPRNNAIHEGAMEEVYKDGKTFSPPVDNGSVQASELPISELAVSPTVVEAA